MASNSKRININPDILMEYVYDDSNYKSEDYKILSNLKDNSKNYVSTLGLNTEKNSLVLIDSINDKYSPVNVNNFNFLRLQNYPSSLMLYDRVKLYFSSGFDFYNDYLGFYLNIYTYGYDNNTKYYLSNYYYSKDNPDSINIFTLSTPFLYNATYWVKSIEFDIPSLYYLSNQRLITLNENIPTPNSLNYNLTNGEGLSMNSPIMFEFGFISSKQIVLDVPYYYMSDLYSMSIPQVPEFDEIGVEVGESSQGDYFEIYGTYMGSNENIDNFVYNESVRGNYIELNYIIKVYEENILTNSQTIEISENFSQKILYRPIIQFSNTSAAIDVELRIINKVDSSYISKFGSVGITNSINKYGRKLTRLNLDSGVIKTDIFNLKYKNILGSNNDNGLMGINSSIISNNNNFNNVNFVNNTNGSNTNGSNTNGLSSVNGIVNTSSSFDIVKVPYPVMFDKYKVMVKTNISPSQTDFVSNGLLDIIITSFDTIINFNIGKDINTKGEVIPYSLVDLINNSKILLVFKSDTDKVEKGIYFDAPNDLEHGNIYFKVEESDYLTLKKIYNSGFDNFYIIINSTGTNTQLYSGRFVFYEDVNFVSESTSTNSTLVNNILNNINNNNVDGSVNQEITNTESVDNSDYNKDKLSTDNSIYTTVNMTPSTIISDDNYINLMIYIRYQTNQDTFDKWLLDNKITPKYKYSSMYFLERIEKNSIKSIKDLPYVEKVFEVPLNTGTSSATK